MNMDKYVLNYTTCLLAIEETLEEFNIFHESKNKKLRTLDVESLSEFFEQLKKNYKVIVHRDVSKEDYEFMEERILHCLKIVTSMENWLPKSKDNILVGTDDFAQLMLIKGTLIEHLKMIQDTLRRL